MENDFNKLPSRIRQYLLEWKYANKEEWELKYGDDKTLFDFNTKELYEMFKYQTEKDYSLFNLFGKFESFE